MGARDLVSDRGIDARRLISVQPVDALGSRQQMTILGGGKFYTVPKPAHPDALAASGPIVEQTKPLRAAAAARADQHRPEAAIPEAPHPDPTPYSTPSSPNRISAVTASRLM